MRQISTEILLLTSINDLGQTIIELLSHFKEIENWVLDACETAYHPSCSAKMGKEDDPMAVVDSSCRVFGTQNLRVVDSSIMPSGTFYATC